MAISRSVIIPTSLSFSPTGIEPASISSMIFATSRMLCPGLATRTSRVIASLTRMGSLLSWFGLPGSTEQEIDRGDDRRHRDCNTAAHGGRSGGDDEGRLLGRERLGRRDAQE